jgi:hypothetical protein
MRIRIQLRNRIRLTLPFKIKFFSEGEGNRMHGPSRIDRNLIYLIRIHYRFRIQILIRIRISIVNKLNPFPMAEPAACTGLPRLIRI